MSSFNLIVDVLILVLVYAFIANRLLAIGSHFRARALDLGTQLLDDPQVPDSVKITIENWLCDIPKTSHAWLLNLLLIPACIIVVVKRWTGRSAAREGLPIINSPYWKKWDDFMTMAIIASFCNSPLAFAFGIIQMIFGVSLVRGNYVVWVTISQIIHRDDTLDGVHKHA